MRRDESLRHVGNYSTVSVAVCVVEPTVAVIVTVCADGVADVRIVKVAVVLPCATVTVVGTVARNALLDFSCTTCPPNCAGPDSVTVPLALLPPATVVGDTVTLCNWPAACGFTVRLAVADPAVPSVAVIVTVCAALTVKVVMVKVALAWPKGMFTVPGVDAKAVPLDVTLRLTP